MMWKIEMHIVHAGVAGNGLDQLTFPQRIAFDPTSSTLYVADTDGHRILRYVSSNATGSIVAGGNGLGTNRNQLSFPTGLYFESSSNSLVIANSFSHTIVRWVLGASNWTLIAGNPAGSAGSSSTSLNIPSGLTLDPMGNIYVADAGNHRIQFFYAGQPNGTTVAGVTGLTGVSVSLLAGPQAVILDAQLNMYVADRGNNRVLKFQHT